MKILKQLISAVTLLILASAAVAQTEEISSNVITSGSDHTWQGVVTNSTHVGGTGPEPVYVPGSNLIVFGYAERTASQIIGINTALSQSGSGIQVTGIDYSWRYFNTSGNRGTLSATIGVTSSTGLSIYNNSYILSQNDTNTWVNFSNSYTFGSIYDITDMGNLTIGFTGVDDKNQTSQPSYQGPAVSNVNARFRYTVDPCISNPQSSPSCKTFYTISDDSYAIVPIPFGFPLYGQIFTHSIFFDNGAVSFYSPTQPQRLGGRGLSMPTVSDSISSSFFYTIVPLKTDLIANGGRHYTQGDGTFLRYTWEDVSQFGRWDSRNTFSLEIRPTGYIGLQYDKIDIQGSWTSAVIGDASLGEYQLIDSNSSTITTSINSWSINETVATNCSNPLNHPSCPGHTEAYALKVVGGNSAEFLTIEALAAETVVIAELQPVTATASPADSATAPVSLISEPAATTQLAAAAAPAPKNEPTAAPAPTTTRQALAAQRQAAARAQAAQRARENPAAVAEEMDNAASMEQQVEAQEAVLGAMGFVAGFDAYSQAIIPDGVGYAPFVIYPGQQNVDTPAARRLLGGSDRLHQDMIDGQYR